MTELLELRTKTLLMYLLCFRTLLPALSFPCDFDLIYITTMKKEKKEEKEEEMEEEGEEEERKRGRKERTKERGNRSC